MSVAGGNNYIKNPVELSTIVTGDGADSITSGGCYTSINAGDGNNRIIITGAQGNNSILAGKGDNYISLMSNSGSNFISISAGNSTIYAGSGNDTLNGAAGNNTLEGGKGFNLGGAAATTHLLSAQAMATTS